MQYPDVSTSPNTKKTHNTTKKKKSNSSAKGKPGSPKFFGVASPQQALKHIGCWCWCRG